MRRGACSRRLRVEVEAEGRARSCHGVGSGMPGTQLCAWLPGEDDRREEGGLGRLGLALGDG